MTVEKYQYKLLGVTMNDGTIFRPNKLMVIVGPNNAGKSRILKEIAAHTTASNRPAGIVVSAVDVNYPATLADLRQSYDIERYQDTNGNWTFRVLNSELNQEHSISHGGGWPYSHEQQFSQQTGHFERFFAEQFGRAMVAFLTTEARLQLVREGESLSHNWQASSLLQMLYRSGHPATQAVSDLAKQAFGQEVELDFTIPQRLQLRVGKDFSKMPPDPRDARPLMQHHERLDDQGDGIRSFVGISAALLTLNRGLFLVDEPEVFLHPPQAYRIGAFIADQTNRSRQIIIATHSTDVLRGILSRTQDVDIVRIDRIGNVNKFRHLNTERLKDIINDPLLTSARVLDGLFYSAAVVVEADSDARFYHAVSVRRSPNLDLHFVNADNKQTVPRIVRMYRDMGVRSAGIVDFDVLNDRTEFDKSLKTLEVIDGSISEMLESQRQIGQAVKELSPNERLDMLQANLSGVSTDIAQVINRTFSSLEEEQRAKELLIRKLESRFREMADMTKAWKVLKQSGRSALLPLDLAHVFDKLWNECATYGLFINPLGELESMLTSYGIQSTSDKKGWITQALQLVPSLEPDDAKQPWEFMKALHEHLVASSV
jgi:predicted ATPase